MTNDITELAQMKGQKVEGSYYLAECTDCGKMYPSNKLNGGEPLFCGDYGECYCPHCNADDAAIGDCGDTAATAWNYQQNRIDALVEALEKAQQYAKERDAENQDLMLTVGRLRVESEEIESRTVTAAAADVLAERQRQVTTEGWTPEHDDKYEHGQLAGAASCYARHVNSRGWVFHSDPDNYRQEPESTNWPWHHDWWKPTNPRRDLVKAGALILAEIERLDRAAGIKWEAE